MVHKSFLKKLSKILTELCEKHGVSSNLAVANYMDNECDVEIAKDLANERMKELDAICEELRKVEGVRSIWDSGAGKVLRGEEVRRFEITVEDGLWSHTEADEIASDNELREYFDDDYAEKIEKKRMESRKNHWKDFIIPLPEPDGNTNTELYLTMAYEPYDWIKDGYFEDGKKKYKRTEFRAYTERYAKKLLGHPIKTVKFQRGYGGLGRPKPEQMVFEVKSITLWDSKSKIECDPRKLTEGIIPDFFAINLGKRIQ